MIVRNLASFKNIFGNNEKSNENDEQPGSENVSFAKQDLIEKDTNLSNEKTIKYLLIYKNKKFKYSIK